MDCQQRDASIIASLIKKSNWVSIQANLENTLGISISTFSDNGSLIADSRNECAICDLFCKEKTGSRRERKCLDVIDTLDGKNSITYFSCIAKLNMFAFTVDLKENRKLIILGGRTYNETSDLYNVLIKAKNLDLSEKEFAQIVKSVNIKPNADFKKAAKFTRASASILSFCDSSQIYKERFTKILSLFNLSTSFKDTEKNDDLFANILNCLIILFDIELTSILLWEQKSKTYNAFKTVGASNKAISNLSIDKANPFVKKMISSGEYINCSIERNSSKNDLLKDVKSTIFFPLFIKQQLIAILAVYNSTLTDKDLRIISLFTFGISTILENRQKESSIDEYVGSLMKFIRCVKAFQDLNADENMFESVLNKVAEFADARFGSFMMYDDKTKELSIKAAKGINQKVFEFVKVSEDEGISGEIFSTGKPVVVSNIEKDIRFARSKKPRYNSKSFMSIPVKIKDKVVGIINLADKNDGTSFNSADMAAVDSLIYYASIALERFYFVKNTDELKKKSIADPLTGLLNKRFFLERLTEEVERSKRHKLDLSLMVIDIDDFSNINNTFGKKTGDNVIVRVSKITSNTLRNIDVISRYDGGRFIVLLPQTKKEDANDIAQRLCKKINNQELVQGKHVISFTASIGLTSLPENAHSFEEMIEQTDAALYLAKTTGKNKVVLHA